MPFPDFIRPGTLTRAKAEQLNRHMQEIAPLMSMRASWPLILDKTWCGWVIGFDLNALAGQQMPNQLTTSNALNPVTSNTVNNFNTQNAPTINLTDASAPTTITGILPGVPGQTVNFQNNTDYPVYFTYLDSSSTVDGQIVTPTETTLVLPPCSSATFKYGKGEDQDKWAPADPPQVYYPIIVPQITSNQTALDPGSNTPINAITSDAERSVFGIVNGPNYYLRTFINTGSFDLLFPHNSGSAADPSYRFTTPTGLDVTLEPGQTVEFYYDPVSDRNIVTGGTATGVATVPATSSSWVKITKTAADFAAAATTNNIEIYSLPAGGVIEAVKIKHPASFSDGGSSSYGISVGIAGALTKYTNTGSFNVFQATGATVGSYYSYTGPVVIESQTAATSIRANATSDVNLNLVTVGSVNIWLKVSVAT